MQISFILPFLLVALSASAQEPPQTPDHAQLSGVWQGKLGKQDIHFCNDGDERSAYYYDKYLQMILLKPGPGSHHGLVLLEDVPDPADKGQGKPVPRWQLQAPVGDQLQGEWLAADGRKLSLALRRLPVAQGELPCSSMAMHGALIKLKAVNGEAQRYQGKAYRQKSLEIFNAPQYGLQIVEILEGGAGRAGINQQLGRQYLSLGSKAQELYACRLQVWRRKMPGFEGEWRSQQELVFWNAHYLSIVQQINIDCDGRIYADHEAFTFSWPQGQKIAPLHWLSKERRARQAWRKLLHKNFPEMSDPEQCMEGANPPEPDRAWLSEKGVVFAISEKNFSLARRACARNVTLSVQELWPLLSAAGRNALNLAYPPP